MNPERRKLRINVEILKSLDQLSGLMEPQDSLLTTLRLSIQPVVLESEFSGALGELEAGHYIVSIREPLSGLVKWGITDKGRGFLAGMN
jgi:hypothetical protein